MVSATAYPRYGEVPITRARSPYDRLRRLRGLWSDYIPWEVAPFGSNRPACVCRLGLVEEEFSLAVFSGRLEYFAAHTAESGFRLRLAAPHRFVMVEKEFAPAIVTGRRKHLAAHTAIAGFRFRLAAPHRFVMVSEKAAAALAAAGFSDLPITTAIARPRIRTVPVSLSLGCSKYPATCLGSTARDPASGATVTRPINERRRTPRAPFYLSDPPANIVELTRRC